VVASHQQVEIPLVSALVIRHDRHAVACGCGKIHRAPAPAGAGAPGTVTYGPNLQAWCVYLMAAHAVPVHRCAGLIESLTGARPSAGFVHSMLGPGRRRGRGGLQADPGARHPGRRGVLR
jgi:transposase